MSWLPDDSDSFYDNEFDDYDEDDDYFPLSQWEIDRWLDDLYDEEYQWEEEQIEIVPSVTLDGHQIARDDFK